MQRPLAEPIPLSSDGSDFPAALRAEALGLLDLPDGPRLVAELLVRAAADEPLPTLAEAAIALRGAAPMDRAVWAVTDQLVYSQVPNWHWAMLRDRARATAYRTAIEASVRSGMLVLEIGAGTGVLAMMAAQAGADHVFTVEANPLLAKIARQCIARNGLSDRITVLAMHSTEVVVGRDLPGRADLLVHEILSSAVLGEGLAPTLDHAQAELLVPDAPLLPEFIGIEAALSQDVTAGDEAWWQVDEFDLSPLSLLDAAAHGVPGKAPRQRLSAPVGVAEIDLRAGDLMQPRRFAGPVEASRSGTVAGVEQWMKVCFPGGVVLNSDDCLSHWGTCYHPFGAQREIAIGEKVDIEVALDSRTVSIGLNRETCSAPTGWIMGL
ncbi:MAG: 50S ribosomal protein L11 methyltransferase [Pseudomonadota bacterium]